MIDEEQVSEESKNLFRTSLIKAQSPTELDDERVQAIADEEAAIIADEEFDPDSMSDWDKLMAEHMYTAITPHIGPKEGDEYYGKPMPTQIVDTNMRELIERDPKWAHQQLKHLTYDRSKMYQGEASLIERGKRFLRDMNKPKLSPDEANAYAKSLGYDLKFSDPVTLETIQEGIDTRAKNDWLENAIANAQMAEVQPTGWVARKLREVAILGSSIAGGFSLAETVISLGATAAAGWVGSLAAGATAAGGIALLKNSASVAKALERAKKILRFNRSRAINKAATDPTAPASSRLAASMFFPKADLVKKEALQKSRLLLLKQLEKLKLIGEGKYTGLDKTMFDAAGFYLTDYQFLRATESNMRAKGTPDLYTEKDKMIDHFVGASLGIFLPWGARGIGRALRLSNPDLVLRRVGETEAQVRYDKAMGKIDEATADKALDTLKKIKVNVEASKVGLKNVNPYFLDKAEQLAKINTDSATLHAQVVYISNLIKAGRIPKISMVPEFQSMMSHFDARDLSRLSSESADEVFKDKLIRSTSKLGVEQIEISGETGLLGRVPLRSFNAADLEGKVEAMYKGFVLEDEHSRDFFKGWADSLEDTVFTMVDLVDKYDRYLQENIQAKELGQPAAHPAAELSLLKEEFRTAYLTHRLGRNSMIGYTHAREQVKLEEAMTGESAMPARYQEIDREFEDWFAQFFTSSQKKTGVVYDFVNAKGKPDGGTHFRAYLQELQDAVISVQELAHTDEYLELMALHPGKLEANIESMMKYELPPDTDFQKLVGVRRLDSEKLREIIDSTEEWNNVAALERVAYKGLENTPEFTAAMRDLQSYTPKNVDTDGWVNSSISLLRRVNSLREEEFGSLRTALQKNIETNINLQSKSLSSLTEKRVARGLYIAVREALVKSLDEVGLSKFIPEGPRFARKSELINSVMNSFKSQVEKDPNILYGLLNPEATATKVGATESAEEAIQTSANKLVSYMTTIEPLIAGVEQEFTRLELQTINNLTIASNMFKKMLEDPVHAAEVPTAAATQSQFYFEGANSSLEATRRSSTLSINDIKETLRSMDSADGSSKLDAYLDNPENSQAISDALIDIKYGVENAQLNTDAARVARTISDEWATLLSMFRRLGAKYDTVPPNIFRSQMKYFDQAMTDNEIDNFLDSFNELYGIDAKNFDTRFTPESEGQYRRGDRLVEMTDDLKKQIKDAVTDIRGVLESIDSIQDASYRKATFWALRDFDLDAMFNRGSDADITLNELRTALLSEDAFLELIDNDIQRLFDMSVAMKKLEKSLLGTDIQKSPNDPSKIILAPDAWIKRFESGFTDIAAHDKNAKPAAVDALETGIRFISADAERHAVSRFGYPDVGVYLKASFDTILEALGQLEKLGTSPLRMVDDLVAAYNAKVRNAEDPLRETLREINRKHNKSEDDITQYLISEGAADSIRDNISIAAGLYNSVASAPIRWVRLINKFIGSPMLIRAGVRSIEDYGTILEGLITRGLLSAGPVASKAELIQTLGDVIQLHLAEPEFFQMSLAVQAVTGEELLGKMLNDPNLQLADISKVASFTDKMELAANKWSDLIMNKFGFMAPITNSNKTTAGMLMQFCIGKYKNHTYKQLSKDMQGMLLRDGILENDWEFMRKYAIINVNEEISKRKGAPVSGFEKMEQFCPLYLHRTPDEVFAKELAARGERNITAQKVKAFKRQMVGKAWNMIEATTNDLISIPSGRVVNWLRGGKAKNTGVGVTMELVTLYKSFAASLIYNTFGARLANFAWKETGVSIVDVMNPFVKLNNINRFAVYNSILGIMTTLTLTSMVINTAVNASTGNLQLLVDQKGKIHLDTITESLLSSMGVIGVVLDAVINAVEGAGQRGSGFALEIAPTIASPLRSLYRLGKALTSKRIADKDRGKAFAAAIAQEVARNTGIKNHPATHYAYQYLIGDYLEMLQQGGRRNYRRYLKNRENRGMVIPKWQRDPETGWDRLQNLE